MTTLSPEARKFSQEEIDKAEETLLRAAIKNAGQDCFNACRVLFDHGAQLSSTIDTLTAEVERLRESVSASAAQYDAWMLGVRLRAALLASLRDLGLGITADVLEQEGTGRLDTIAERLAAAVRRPDDG